jgi:hypothetical protein
MTVLLCCPALPVRCSFADDLKTLTEQLTRVRAERLRRLYDAERAEWQRALQEKGLSIEDRGT